MKRVITQDEATRKSVEKEIAVLARVGNNTHIIQYYGACKRQDDQTQQVHYYLLLEYCPNGTIWDLIRPLTESKTPSFLPEARVVQVFLQTCLAVQCLHACSPPIAHRDIKIENVLLGKLKHCVDIIRCTSR